MATITAGGLATGVGVGTSNITAALSGVTSPADVLTVTAATLQSIAVTPVSPTIAKGATQQFTATGTYSDSSTANITASVSWNSATTTMATITAGGLATGVGVGTSNITAALSGVTSPADVLTVTAATLQSIAVTPVSPTIAKGATQQFTATGTYSDSSTQNLTSQVAWNFGEHRDGDHHGGRAGDGSGSGDEQHHGGAQRSDVAGGCVDGDGGDAAIDRGDAGESDDRQGGDAAVHGDGNVQRQQHAEHHDRRRLDFVCDAR